MKNWKDNIYFVLAEPKEPGNIGASARAIKNMDFKHLCLVNPPPLSNSEAQWFAHNAKDILESAEISGSVREAVGDKHFVAGTSRRRGRRRGAFIPVEEGMKRIYEIAHTGKVAVLFGREDKGLYNDEVEECGFLMTIPVSRKHPSLNLAQAVMIIAYELSKAGIRGKKATAGKADDHLITAAPPKVVNQKELSFLYARMEKALKLIGYIPPDNEYLNWKIMHNMKHCLGRAGLTDWEYNMFNGICNHIEQKLGNRKQ